MNRPIVAVVFVLLAAGITASQNRHAAPPLTSQQMNSLKLAIEDEIYDRGYQKKFYLVGPEITLGVTRLPLYAEPDADGNGGTVVYKLMPFGEVMRGFYFSKDGLAVLEGDPDSGFPPTNADILTVYLDDDDVCHWKRTWKRYHFDIIDSPSPERIKEAGERQKKRVGYSYPEMPPKEQRTFPPK